VDYCVFFKKLDEKWNFRNKKETIQTKNVLKTGWYASSLCKTHKKYTAKKIFTYILS